MSSHDGQRGGWNRPRRGLYRRGKRLLIGILERIWQGPRPALEPAVRAFLRARPRGFLRRLANDRPFALAVAAALATAPIAAAEPPIHLGEIALGDGGFIINGAQSGDHSHQNISGIGDMNGDGIPDVVIGAPYVDPIYAGAGYVVFGKPDNLPVSLAAVEAGSGGFFIQGAHPSGRCGWSVSGAGDVNGDGLPDVIVGAPYVSAPSFRSGQSYVVFGKADTKTVLLADVISGSGGFAINGAGPYDISGWSVSGAGDVNGDGLDDIIVGAPKGGFEFTYTTGHAYVVFGKPDGAAVGLADVAGGDGGFIMNGLAGVYDYTGWSVSGAGDVNGDGLDDVIVGGASSPVVVFGKADGVPIDLDDVVAGKGAGFALIAPPGVSAGSSVSGAGDVNGDGLPDVLVGSVGADPHGVVSAGVCRVIFGRVRTSPVFTADIDSGTGGFVINGENAGDFWGQYTSGGGDVNADGLADVIIGAPFAGGTGRAAVVYGRTRTTAIEIADVAKGSGGFIMTGITANDRASRVAGVGDMNGAGKDDVFVGAPEAEPPGSNSGEGYMVFSPAGIVSVVRYVDDDAPPGGNGSDWASAIRFLEDAIDADDAPGTDTVEIRVAQGTYHPDRTEANAGGTGDRTASFQPFVNMTGGYAGLGAEDPDARDPALYETILSGDLAGNDGPGFVHNGENSLHVVRGPLTAIEIVMDGFVISGGNADVPITDSSGGGILIDAPFGLGGFRPRHCVIRGNRAVQWGGGMFSTAPVVEDCTFIDNQCDALGGALFVNISGATVRRCTFIGNEAPCGGGLHVNQLISNWLVEDCTFIGNRADNGGGLHASGNLASRTLRRCTFIANNATQAGGGLLCGSPANISNCVLIDNVAETGGGMRLGSNSSVTSVAYCTFSGNAALSGGAIRVGQSSSALVTSCIAWGSSPGAFTGTVTVSASTVEGGWPGAGNIDDDPMFVDRVGGDVHVLPGSPVIDAGSNVDDIAVDRDGNPRRLDDHRSPDGNLADCPVADMGAYEFPGTPECPACPWDCQSVPDDGVTIVDLLALLAQWGQLAPCDIDGDGAVGITDLLDLLAHWGLCP